MQRTIETVIIGGGQAGLSVSYCLGQAGREHVILEQADRPAHAWRDDRWDSFTLVTPNWSFLVPGAEYGFPDAPRGSTRCPGLYFAGMPWLPGQNTGLLVGVAETARAVAEKICATV